MGILNDLGNIGTGLGNAIAGGATALDQAVNSTQQGFQQGGFTAPAIPNGNNGNGLPSSNIAPLRTAVSGRDVAHWFIPDVGIVNMYINPQTIRYGRKKLITTERTKGGFSSQYWGEELMTLELNGHTGSSGVEGLNVLEEVYRSEQILFDPIALTMAADNSISGMNDLIDSALGNLGGFPAALSQSTLGVLGLDPASQNILPQNPPSLAAMAFGIELYYNNWVFRGWFNSFSYTESVSPLGLWEYQISFTVSQRRGYRLNTMPWQKSAISGPSNNGIGGPPLSVGSLISG
jgi:hypothetical protein